MWKKRLLCLCLAGVLLVCWRDRGAVTAAAPAEISAEEEKLVALTFDDGPRQDTTERLLDGLLERGASATFFLIGQQIAGNEALVRRMQAEGHQVGNHTWSHLKLQGQSDSVVRQEVGDTDALLQTLLGPGQYWVRPPYGLLNKGQRALFSVPLVHWMVDPEDWKLRNADADVQAVLGAVKPGDIILMHDSVAASVDAALRIVDALQAQGYRFVTVEELLRQSGVTPEPGVMYRSATVRADA
jgi:peptidoglycan/xylan/chitin deacetylase (PgdA/CDA1 family)